MSKFYHVTGRKVLSTGQVSSHGEILTENNDAAMAFYNDYKELGGEVRYTVMTKEQAEAYRALPNELLKTMAAEEVPKQNNEHLT